MTTVHFDKWKSGLGIERTIIGPIRDKLPPLIGLHSSDIIRRNEKQLFRKDNIKLLLLFSEKEKKY